MEEETRISSVHGVLTLEEPLATATHTTRVEVNGRAVLVDSMSHGLAGQAYWEYPPQAGDSAASGLTGATALIAVAIGGRPARWSSGSWRW